MDVMTALTLINSSKSNETTIQRLGVVIGTINAVKDLVPNDGAKAVLSAISFILTTVQVSSLSGMRSLSKDTFQMINLPGHDAK